LEESAKFYSGTDMRYMEKNLVPGDILAYRTGCHWVVMFWPMVGGAVLGFVGLAFFADGWMATRNGGRYEGAMVWGGLALLGAVALITGGMIRRFAAEVAVSNRPVLIKAGLLSRRSVEVLLPKVESIGVDESFLGRILGYGRVTVRGKGGTFETFDKIAHPNELRRQVQQQTGSLTSA
jgi:uncharacterized membrane protein YdbT with pleckstrin-like domain